MADMEPNEALANNVAEFMEDGPGLRITTRTWIAARDDVNGYVLLCGLGGMGVGTMWTQIKLRDDGTPYRQEDSGWDDAPIVVTEPVSDGFSFERRIIEGDEAAVDARTPFGMMFRRGDAPKP